MSVLRKTRALFMTESLHDTILDKLSLSPISMTFKKSSVEDDCNGYMKVVSFTNQIVAPKPPLRSTLQATKRDEVLSSAVKDMISNLSNHIDLVQRSPLFSALESFCEAFALEKMLSVSALAQKTPTSWASRQIDEYQAIRAVPWCAHSIAIRSVLAHQYGTRPLIAHKAQNGTFCVEWQTTLCHFRCMEAALWPGLDYTHASSIDDWQ